MRLLQQDAEKRQKEEDDRNNVSAEDRELRLGCPYHSFPVAYISNIPSDGLFQGCQRKRKSRIQWYIYNDDDSGMLSLKMMTYYM
jgi:hypothetical protein